MTLAPVELATWLANNTPPGWRGPTTAFRSGVLHRMLELPPGEHSHYIRKSFASAYLAGFTALDCYLASGGQLLCPACVQIWSAPPSPRPPLTLKSWLAQTRPEPSLAMFASAFSAGASARLRGVPRDSCTYQKTWRNPSVATRLADHWRAGYDRLDAFLAQGNIVHCHCCFKQWSPRPDAPNPSLTFQLPIVRLLARLDQITT